MTRFLYACARWAPWFVRGSESFWMALSKIGFRHALRSGPMANARWLCGPNATQADRSRLSDDVLRSFYRFIYDISHSNTLSPQQILDKVADVQGREHYDAARAARRGIIIATAHMGSFEVGMAALRNVEDHVHVVFQRDVFSAFDQLRERLHRKLGVIDAPVEDGVSNWLALCEALCRNEAVLIQADRIMPGQHGLAVPMLGGHIRLPLGPIKLAAISGAPIVPVFTLRRPDGRMNLAIEPAIHVLPEDHIIGCTQAPRPLLELAAVIEKFIKAHPDQWLMLSSMWCEDTETEFGPNKDSRDQRRMERRVD